MKKENKRLVIILIIILVIICLSIIFFKLVTKPNPNYSPLLLVKKVIPKPDIIFCPEGSECDYYHPCAEMLACRLSQLSGKCQCTATT